jgi:hypothetical protein
MRQHTAPPHNNTPRLDTLTYITFTPLFLRSSTMPTGLASLQAAWLSSRQHPL